MSAEDLHHAKRELRKRVREARCALDIGTCARHAETAAENLLALPELKFAHVVMAYAANAEEIDPGLAVDALHGLGKVVAMPRIEAPGVLGVHLVGHCDELERGPLGIRQPHESAPRIPLDSVDVVIVPGVAFDEEGYRLGYGGGYYDRLLPQLRDDCLRIGLAYDEQVVRALPAAEHDQPMHAVVTPTRLIKAKG